MGILKKPALRGFFVAVFLTLFFSPFDISQPAHGDFLNDYLSGLTLGAKPGPCPDKARRCGAVIDPARMNPATANIYICLLDGYCFIDTFFGCILRVTACDYIKNWFKGGSVYLWEGQCKSLGLESADIQTVSATNTKIVANVQATKIKQACNGWMRLDKVHIAKGIFGVEITGDVAFTTTTEDSSNFAFQLQFTSPDFSTKVANDVVIPLANCNIYIGANLHFDLINNKWESAKVCIEYAGLGCIFSLSFLPLEGLTNIIVTGIEASFGGILCDIASQAAKDRNGNDGELNQKLDEFGNFITRISSGKPDDVIDIDEHPKNYFPELTNAQLASARNFSDDNVLELLSLTLNSWFGKTNANGRLIINDAIDQILDNDIGEYSFDFIAEGIRLNNTVEMSMADVFLQLNKITFQGLNNIETFKLLDNNFQEGTTPSDRLTYTLNHSLAMGSIKFIADIETVFKRGRWVTNSADCPAAQRNIIPFKPTSSDGYANEGHPDTNPCTADQERFVLKFGMTWTDFLLEASTFSVYNTAELNEVQLGQLFGRDFRSDPIEAGKNVARCLAPGMYAAMFPSLSLSIGNINSPPEVVIPSSTGLQTLIVHTVVFVDKMFNSVFRLAAPGIMQGEIRPEINEFLDLEVVGPADLANCAPYVVGQIPESDKYFNFSQGLLKNIYPLINNVLGNFVDDTETDINDGVQIILSYFSNTYEDFPLETQGDPGEWRLKPNDRTLFYFPGFGNGVNSTDRFFNVSSFEIANLDSVYQLHAEDFGTKGQGINLDAAIGYKLPADIEAPFTLSFLMQTKVDDAESERGAGDLLPIDETIKFELQLAELNLNVTLDSIKINRDKLYQLRFRQLGTTPCLLTVFDGGFDVVESNLSSAKIFVKVDTSFSQASPPDPLTVHPFIIAMYDLEVATSGEPTIEFKNMVNTILFNSLHTLLLQVERFDQSETALTCDFAADPIGSVFKIFTGFELPDLNGTVEKCIAEPTDVLTSPEQAESAIIGLFQNTTYFDWSDSFIVDAIQSEFGTNLDDNNRNSVLRDIVFLLANQSGTPLTDSFFIEVIEEDGHQSEVVSFLLDTANGNFIFDLFGIEPLVFENPDIIPDFHAEISNITIRGIDRFAAQTKLFEVKSRFVTGYYFAFTEDNPLIIDINGFISADNSFKGITTPGTLVEAFNIRTEITGFELEFELLAAINTGYFGNLTLGHFFEVTAVDQDFVFAPYAENCFFSCFFENGLSIPRLNMSIDSLKGPNFTTTEEIFSHEVANVIDEFISLMTQLYIDSIPNIAYNCLRGSINEALANRWQLARAGDCPAKPVHLQLPAEDEIFRFRTSKGLQRFQNFLSENFKANDYELWNKIMLTLTKDSNGNNRLLFDTDPLGPENITLSYKGVDYGKLTAIIFNMEIEDLNTFDHFKLIESVPYDDFTAVTGFNITNPTFEFLFQIVAYDVFKGYDVLENDLRIKIELLNWDFGIAILAKVNVTEALNIRFSSVSSTNELPCLLVPLDQLSFEDFNFTVDDIRVEISCFNKCEFPLFQGALENGAVINSEDDEQLAALVNELILFTTDYVEGTGIQRLIDAQIATAEQTCAEILGLLTGFLDVSGSDDLEAAIFMGYVFLGFAVVSGMGVLALFPMHNARRIKRLKEFATERKTMEYEKEYLLLKNQLKSMFQHSATPVLAKVLIPVLCVIHIFGLIIAIVFSGAMNVILVFKIFGADTDQIILVPFTIVSTIDDIWNSGSYYLAIIIALASCFWPIVKNMLLILIWFLPTTLLPIKSRGKFLFYLDALGKWSFLDVFIVVMTLASLRTYLRLSAYSRIEFLPEDTFNVDVNVTPERGIVLLLVIASSSLVVNHVISWYHEKIIAADQKMEDELRGVLTTAPKRAAARNTVFEHKFAGADKKGRKKIISRKAVRVLMMLNAVSGLFVLIGVFLPLVTFEMKGLIGLLISQIDHPLATKTYSIVDLSILVGQAPHQTPGDIFIVTFFQILLLAVGIIFPFVQIATNVFILFAALSLESLKKALWGVYLVSFWSAIECFLVAVVLTLLEIDRITIYIIDFISEDFCSNVQALLETLLGPTNGKCLDVDGRLEMTSFFIFVGVFFQLLVNMVVLHMTEAVVEDRYFVSYNGVRRDVKPGKQSYIRKQVMRIMTKRAVVQKKKKQDNGDGESVVSGFSGLSGFSGHYTNAVSAVQSSVKFPKKPVKHETLNIADDIDVNMSDEDNVEGETNTQFEFTNQNKTKQTMNPLFSANIETEQTAEGTKRGSLDMFYKENEDNKADDIDI